jgi:N-acetyl-gamma-glutamyl-phosphate/LysW-gamma-L-alpha-aminoadipyl-6-phosphate reductase
VGTPIAETHPNLRRFTSLTFTHPNELQPCDVLFLALPHGEAGSQIEKFSSVAEHIIDTSADFRLKNPEAYQRWYGKEHPTVPWLPKFQYGLPERNRDALVTANYVSGVGCNATVLNLALGPLADAGWLEKVVADIKVGSSEAGAATRPGSHHPERKGVVRVYSTGSHRHLAEVEQSLGPLTIHLTVTAIEMVRGVHLTAHAFLSSGVGPVGKRQVWRLYRQAYGEEPFIRLVAKQQGLYRYPEPKILAGTNFCDIGFTLSEDGTSLVIMAALDNLMKGGAGTAVQSMNIMLGLDEGTGLEFPGLHPI